MMYDLFQHAQEFLRLHNVDPKKSFYDQMMEQERMQTEVRRKEASAVQAASQQEAMLLKKERKLQIQTQAKEEVKRRKQLFRSAKPRAARIATRDLWGSDSDPSSEDNEQGEGARSEEDDNPDQPARPPAADALHRARAPPAPAERAGGDAARGGEGSGGGAEELRGGAWGGGQIRWRKFGSMKAVGDGEVALVPEVVGIGRFGVVYMAMVEANDTPAPPRPGAVIAIKEIRLEEDPFRKRDQLAKAAREIDCQRHMAHDNIVQATPPPPQPSALPHHQPHIPHCPFP